MWGPRPISPETDEGLEAVRNAKLAATVYNDKEGQAAAIMKLSAALTTENGMDKMQFEKEQSGAPVWLRLTFKGAYSSLIFEFYEILFL